ncbi:hypothetical protein [Algoriphagus sp. CAU 1675]|uniref:hypothetical protein n=1 Tax=Algoriphagus sp. CAU 1675 TaxID=3032597 RepID=UPI0023DCB6B4|nr:hypothetical protein [Algoriphagus sp. CAU 1675]MDF2157315.1 hypothetical protein [Algoriphagus sp. CAU 1675]
MINWSKTLVITKKRKTIMKKLYILLAVAFASLAMTSCFDDPGTDVFFNGNEVEFQDANLPNGLTARFVRNSPTQIDQVSIQVNRVSTNGSAPITMNISVDPSSTAVEGVHYQFTGTSVTLEAGEFVKSFPVTVLTGNIDPSESPNLVLKIDSATGAEVSANYGKMTVAIRVICPSDLAGTWEFANGETTEIEEIGTGNYKIVDLNAMGVYYDPAVYVVEAFFTDNCNILTLYGSSAYGIQWRGTGVYDPDTDTITWEKIADITYNPDYEVEQIVMTRQ